MKSKARTMSIAGLALLVSVGLGACSTDSIQSGPKTTSASPSPSVNAADDEAKAAVVSEVNAFFADISKEVKPFVADRKADPSAYSKLSKDEQVAKARAAFKDSLSHVDESSTGPDKSILLVGGFANTMDRTPGSVLTVQPAGVTVDKDEAKVDGAFLKLAVGGKEAVSGDANSPGSFTLKHEGNRWKITDFQVKDAPATSLPTAAPSQPAK